MYIYMPKLNLLASHKKTNTVRFHSHMKGQNREIYTNIEDISGTLGLEQAGEVVEGWQLKSKVCFVFLMCMCTRAGEGQREEERIPSRLHAVSTEPDVVLSLTNQETMTWAKIKSWMLGHLDGSVGWATNFGSGHDLAVCEFAPRIGFCADSSEPGACFRFCVSLSLTLPCSCSVSPCLKNK